MEIVALDVETANRFRSSVCAIAVATDAGAQRWLFRPAPSDFDRINVSLHGIDERATASAPSFAEGWTEVAERLAGRIVVAHNASFDVAAVLAACSTAGVACPNFEYVCTMRLARAVLGAVPSYSLPALCERFSIPLDHHDPGSDAAAALALLRALVSTAGCSSVDELVHRLELPRPSVDAGLVTVKVPTGAVESDALRSQLVVGESIRGKRIAFTGALVAFPRAVARQIVECEGGDFTEAISKKLDYLVIGAGGGAGSKLDRARALVEAGAALRVITERDFFRLLSDAAS